MRYIIRVSIALLTFALGVAVVSLYLSINRTARSEYALSVQSSHLPLNNSFVSGVHLRVLSRSDDIALFSFENNTEQSIWVEVIDSSFKSPDDVLSVLRYLEGQDLGGGEYQLVWTFGCVFPRTRLQAVSPRQSIKFGESLKLEALNLTPGNYRIRINYIDDPKVAKILMSEREPSKKEAKLIEAAWKFVSADLLTANPK